MRARRRVVKLHKALLIMAAAVAISLVCVALVIMWFPPVPPPPPKLAYLKVVTVVHGCLEIVDVCAGNVVYSHISLDGLSHILEVAVGVRTRYGATYIIRDCREPGALLRVVVATMVGIEVAVEGKEDTEALLIHAGHWIVDDENGIVAFTLWIYSHIEGKIFIRVSVEGM